MPQPPERAYHFIDGDENGRDAQIFGRQRQVDGLDDSINELHFAVAWCSAAASAERSGDDYYRQLPVTGEWQKRNVVCRMLG